MSKEVYVADSGWRVTVHRRKNGWVAFSAVGGGGQVKLPDAQFDDEFKLETSAPAYRAIGACIEGFDCVILRAYSNGERWNGWCKPYFELDEVRRLAQLLEGRATYDELTETFTVQDESYPDEPYVYRAQILEVEGRQIKVWGIGAGDWCWEEEKALPPDPDNMNIKRANSANVALHAFMLETGVDDAEAVADLLRNLMHLCDRMGRDFQAELLRAGGHYAEETKP